MLDLDQEKITLDNFKIDNNDPKNINKFINEFNLQKQNMFNKVTFKNFIKDFFSILCWVNHFFRIYDFIIIIFIY